MLALWLRALASCWPSCWLPGTWKLQLLRRVWDRQTGECKITLQGHTGEVLSVAASADGRTIVSGSWDNSIK